MAQPSSTFQTKKAFFHGLSKVNTLDTQYVFESIYKSAHSVRTDDIWAETVPYAVDLAEAITNVTNNPTVIKKYTLMSLTEVPGTNGQAWYINDNGLFIKDWIAPTDVPHLTTAEPSYGYQCKLYTGTDTLITETQGIWIVDYYAGLVLFDATTTPSIQGWGIPKITCFVYDGLKLSETSGGSPISLDNLNDVTITNIQTNDVLSWNGTSWINIISSGGTNYLYVEAGEDLSKGQVVYIAGDEKVYKADNTTLGAYKIVGIVSADTAISTVANILTHTQKIAIADWNMVAGTATLTPATTYFLGLAGQIASIAPSNSGQTVIRVGRAISSDTLMIDIGEAISI